MGVKFEPRWAFRLRLRIGRRGALLLVVALAYIAYGIAMALSYWDNSNSPPKWWPVTTPELFGISIPIWGVIWIVVGLFILSGIYPRWPDWPQFTAAIALSVWWGFSALVYFLTVYSPGVWGIGATYIGFALTILIACGWEEQS
jgi:peptidoglycan/LPS O-acetylase OafA/YrhL